MGQIQWMVALGCIALFTFAILGFTINFANDNDAYVNLSADSTMSSLHSNIRTNLSTLREQSEASYSSILNTTIEEGSQTAESSAPFTVTLPVLVGSVTNILRVGYYKIFGTDSGFGIFLSILLGLMTVITALFVWKTLLGGPD